MKKTMLITGGGRGIGAATARLAVQRGYAVCINYARNAEAANALLNELRAAGGTAIGVQADVSLEADVLRLFQVVDAELGRLTALVNNAGILDKLCKLESMSAERLQRVFAVNILGAFLCAREAVKRMSTHHGGEGGGIVNVSSAAARIGSPFEFIDYAASKGALDTMTLGLSKEVALEGIRVNAVRAGHIRTELHALSGDPGRVDRVSKAVPMQRGGTALEVAQAILWLLSDEASYVTGTLLDVAGGR